MRDNWSNKSLIEITSLIKDGTHGTHKDVINGIPLLSAKDIENGKVSIPEDSRLISESDFLQIHKSYKLQEEDILLTLVGTIGRVAIINDFTTNFTFQRSVGILRFIPDVDSKYAYYYICSEKFFKQLIRSMNASAQGGVYLGELGKLELEFPESLPHQRKIALILSTCDAVIEKTEAAIAKYQAIKQGMMHDLFTRGILMEDITYTDKKGKVVELRRNQLRPKQEDAPELYKESELGWIPKEWEVEKIGQVSSLVTNGFVGVATPFYTTSDIGIPYLFGTNIRADKIEFNDLRFISREFHTKHIKSQLKPGDMLCVQSGHIGTCAVVPRDFIEANCHALIITRFYLDRIYPEFISSYLNSLIGKKQLDKIIIGSTIKHINTSDLAKHLIPIPMIDEQQIISKRLVTIENKIKTEQSTLSKYRQIKAGLMQDLLSGKVEVVV